MQEIARREAITATDASVKESNMEGVWRIEDLCEFVWSCSIVCFRKWRKNIALDVEAFISLDLVDKVVNNMKEAEEGKI